MNLAHEPRGLVRVGRVWRGDRADHSQLELRSAARAVSDALSALRIPHTWTVEPRCVQVVVGVEAFHVAGETVSFKPGVPIFVDDVPIQYFADTSALYNRA